MHQIIQLKELQTGQAVGGLVLIKDYAKKDMSNKQPLKGVLHHKGKDLDFSIWSNAVPFGAFQDGDLKGSIFYVTGTVSEYNGKKALTIDMVDFSLKFNNHGDFYKGLSVEKQQQLDNDFMTYVNALTEPYKNVVNTVLLNNTELFSTYKQTWAGAKMHDAYIGGLYHHTIKILRIAQMAMYNDNRLAEYADLLYTSIILHDIGKVHEIALDGTYTKISYVTHRSIGVEMLAEHKGYIISQIGVDNYYQILAVIQGHHGEYGDKPTTILTYIIHLMDMLEATTTGILDKIENQETQEKNGTARVWVGSDYPSLVVK